MRLMRWVTAMLTVMPVNALAHGSGGTSLQVLSTDWLIVVSMVLVTVAYGIAWSRSRHGGRRAAAAFAGGIIAAFAALVWPLDGPSDQLFWVHMVQHLCLIAVAAPLLVLGLPRRLLWTSVIGPRGSRVVRRRLWRVLSTLQMPLVVGLAQPLLLSIWHLPVAVAAALASETIHLLMHGSLLVVALAFWSAVLHAGTPEGPRLGGAALLLFSLMPVMALIGAVLTFAPLPLYGDYIARAAAVGWAPLEDQQLAGLIMWVPGSVPYLLAALWLGVRALARLEARAAAQARTGP